MSVSTLPVFHSHFQPLASNYDVLLCDVWGVVHNGIAATRESCDALVRFRQQGGTVILITNAPRPGAFVMKFLDDLSVPRDAYDGVVSSGDVTRTLITDRGAQRVFHIGPERDVPMFDGLAASIATVEQADYSVCSGLFDDTKETPEDYVDLVDTMRARNMPMICANPDIVVERGRDLVYCAGAIADLYAASGGQVAFAGKPYGPIYQQAIEEAQRRRGRAFEHQRILAIGDSVRTDLQGATNAGIDCLFVTAGIHAEEMGGRDSPDTNAASQIFAAAGLCPQILMRTFAW